MSLTPKSKLSAWAREMTKSRNGRERRTLPANEQHRSYRERRVASNLDFLNSPIASSILPTAVAMPPIFKIRLPAIFFRCLAVPDN